jgi:hypothetical protein
MYGSPSTQDVIDFRDEITGLTGVDFTKGFTKEHRLVRKAFISIFV